MLWVTLLVFAMGCISAKRLVDTFSVESAECAV